MAETFSQIPPNSTGNKIRTRSRTVGGNTVQEQAVYQTALPTYYALADNVAFAANKHMISILNAAGSGVVIAIKKLFLVDVQLAAVTGVAVRNDIKKITAHSAGTAITPETADTTNPSLPAQVTVRTGATVTEGNILFPITYTNDETGATQAFPSTLLLQGLNFVPEGIETQEIRLRPGQGITVKNITSTIIGSFAFLIVFTMDDEV